MSEGGLQEPQQVEGSDMKMQLLLTDAFMSSIFLVLTIVLSNGIT